VTRRALLATLIGVPMTAKNVTAQSGFVITDTLTAIEAEKLEGYVNIGNEFGMSAHPKSAVYPALMALVGSKVRVHVSPAE
jgi:hypothetical protein